MTANNIRLTVIVAHKAVDRSECQPSAELVIRSTDGPAMATPRKSQKLALGAASLRCVAKDAESNAMRALRFNNKASGISPSPQVALMTLFGSLDAQKIALVDVLGKP